MFPTKFLKWLPLIFALIVFPVLPSNVQAISFLQDEDKLETNLTLYDPYQIIHVVETKQQHPSPERHAGMIVFFTVVALVVITVVSAVQIDRTLD